MDRKTVEHEARTSEWAMPLRTKGRPSGLPFPITKIEHVDLRAADLRRSVEFYTPLLGFSVTDVYPES